MLRAPLPGRRAFGAPGRCAPGPRPGGRGRPAGGLSSRSATRLAGSPSARRTRGALPPRRAPVSHRESWWHSAGTGRCLRVERRVRSTRPARATHPAESPGRAGLEAMRAPRDRAERAACSPPCGPQPVAAARAGVGALPPHPAAAAARRATPEWQPTRAPRPGTPPARNRGTGSIRGWTSAGQAYSRTIVRASRLCTDHVTCPPGRSPQTTRFGARMVRYRCTLRFRTFRVER